MKPVTVNTPVGEALRVLVGQLDYGERATFVLFAISQISIGELEAGDVTAADIVRFAAAFFEAES